MESSLLIDHYQLLQVVGEGAYGRVFKAMHLPTKKIVAVKQITLINDKRVQRKQLIMLTRELQILYKLSNMPNN